MLFFVVFFLRRRRPPRSTRTDTLFPYTTLFRSVRSCALVQLLGQAAPDLVEDEPDERLGPADVGWRNDQIERHRMGAFDQLPDPPVAATRHLSHHRDRKSTRLNSSH